jgi:hypothetical protein
MVFPWLIDPFFEGTPVKDAGKRYKDKVDSNKKKRQDKLDAQRKRNRKKIGEALEGFFDLISDDLNSIISEEFTIKSLLYTRGGVYGRSALLGFEAAEVVADFAAQGTIEAGGAGALELFTPSIRRYEETALVGLGGMKI